MAATVFIASGATQAAAGEPLADSASDRPGPPVISSVALGACVVIALGLVAFYLRLIWPYVCLPADILMWSETNFVGDIIKVQNGHPIYTPPEDNNALLYTPAAPLVTYSVAWLVGQTESIPAWRLIQLGFVALAALLATLCCRLLQRIADPHGRPPFQRTWLVLTALSMFLASTSPEVNEFSHCLHTDPLALLVSTAMFLSVLWYVRSPGRGRLVLLALCPAVGYLAKQFLISWVGIIAVFLLLHHGRNIRPVIGFVAMAAGLLALAMGACYALWGESYLFWTFRSVGVRGSLSLSPASPNLSLPRMLDHTLRVWLPLTPGFVGGWLLLRGPNVRRLGSLWAAWGVLIASEAFSSGAGWNVLYHFGPGVLIGTVWLFAALPSLWPQEKSPVVEQWLRSALGVAGLVALFAALQVLPTGDKGSPRYWRRQPPEDVYRYIADIEREFQGLRHEDVLLDIGNWVYLGSGVLMKDRAISLADQPPGGNYDNIEVMRRRLCRQTYRKILVREYHSPLFLYDWGAWERPSGVRDALQKHYVEIRTIPGVAGDPKSPPSIRHSGPVSVFVPRHPPAGS